MGRPEPPRVYPTWEGQLSECQRLIALPNETLGMFYRAELLKASSDLADLIAGNYRDVKDVIAELQSTPTGGDPCVP